MVRETRHLWVGNLPDDIREDKLVEHFARYGRVESAKLTGKRDTDGSQSAFVDFVDINSATKAHDASVITIGERDLQIEYNNPDSPTEIHPGETSREYDLPGRIPRYDNRRGGGPVEDRYDTANANYEFERSYGQHYGRENSQYRDETSSSPAYRERQRDRTRANFYSHSRSSDQYENDPDYLKDSYGETFGDVSLRKSRLKTFKTLPGQSPSARSGSGSGRKSKSNSRSRSRSKSTDSHSSDTGSEVWSRSRSRDRESDGESRNTETTQSSMGGSKFAGLCVRNLPARSSDSSIKDGLFHEFKKFGQVTAVTVQGMGEDRKGIVFFKRCRAEDMEKAMEVSRGNSFFGCEMSLSVWDGADLGVDDSEVKYFEKELDEFHPRATRTLFVGNLDRSVTREDLEEAFQKFGEIVHIEIKKPPSAQPFAFLQFSDIDSVVRARKKLDGEYVGKNKLGFGKSMATNCVWLDNLSQKVNKEYLMQFCGLRFGEVTRVVHDRRTNMALVFFINIDDSQKAVEDLKIGNILGRRPKVDFASRECQNHFYDRMEQTGQAAYYNHSRETSPTGPTYPREKYPKAQRRVSRPQSSSKYSGGGSGGGGTGTGGGTGANFDERYPYNREDSGGGGGGGGGYHERSHYKENYSSIKSSSYEEDDYQQELSEYSYHQKERTKEQYRDRSRSSSPSRRERANSRQKSSSVEPAGEEVSPPGSIDEGRMSRSPTPKRKWKANSLMVPNSKEGSGTPMPISPFSDGGASEEPSWKVRNGSSERGSSMDQSDGRKVKNKLSDIPREDELAVVDRKKKGLSKLPSDKSSSPYLGNLKGDIHADSHPERTRENSLLHVDVDKDSWVEKLRDKRSPRNDFLSDKNPLKRGLDSNEPVVLHDGEGLKRWKDDDTETSADDINDSLSREDLQKKLEARKQRFSDNSPVDIQKIKDKRYYSPAHGKVPKLVKSGLRDSDNIPKGDSFLGDGRTVEDSHSAVSDGVPEDGDNGLSCKHNDKIGSFWWMGGQKSYSDEEVAEKPSEAASVLIQQQSFSESGDGGSTQAALNKPKKTVSDNLNLSQDRQRKKSSLGSVGQRIDSTRIPHISNDTDGGIASSSDQEEDQQSLTLLKLHSSHSNPPHSSLGNENSQSTRLSSNLDSFEKPLSFRNKFETNSRKSFDMRQRQRHPSHGEVVQLPEGKEKLLKSVEEKDKVKSRDGHNPKRKEAQGTVIQEMEWKMIPLDPISFPPSGRKEQIDAIFYGSSNDPKEPSFGNDTLGSKTLTASKAAGGLTDYSNDQYCNPLTLNTDGENFRTDADQLPRLSPKPGATKTGNAASPPTSVPPHLSPAATPVKTKEETLGDVQAKANVTKLLTEPLFIKSTPSSLETRNCQKTLLVDRDIKEKAVLSSSTLSCLNEKSSYLRPGEGKVSSWLRQMPSPTPVTLENDPRDRTAFLISNNAGSPSLSVTPSTPSTPSTPNDGKGGEILSTKIRVERLSNCRIVKKNRNSIDIDRNEKKPVNDDLYKYFQERMQESSIFSLDEARLNPDQSKTLVSSSAVLSKSKSEDVNAKEGSKLNRSNSDPRMASGAKLLTLPKTVDNSALGQIQPHLSSPQEKASDKVTTPSESASKLEVVGKAEQEQVKLSEEASVEKTSTAEVPKEKESPSAVTREAPKLRSILKKRTESTDDLDESGDLLVMSEVSKDTEQGLKRKRSPSPPSAADGKKAIHNLKPEKLVLPAEAEKKMESTSLPTTPKFQYPTNMLLLPPKDRKKLSVKPKPKTKTEKPAAAAITPVVKKPAEKSPATKKPSVFKKDTTGKPTNETVKSKSVNSSKEKAGVKPAVKKVEKKEERKVSHEKKGDERKVGDKKAVDEKRVLEKKSSLERKEERKLEKQDDKAAKKSEDKEKAVERKGGEDAKKEDKKQDKKDEKKPISEKKGEKQRPEEKKAAGDRKVEEKKVMKKTEDRKLSKDSKVDEKRTGEKKVSEKKSVEKKSDDRKNDGKKTEDRKADRQEDKRSSNEKKSEEVKKSSEKKLDDKKVEKKLEERKTDKHTEERRVVDKRSGDKKAKGEEKKNVDKRLEEKRCVDKKLEKKVSASSLPERKKSDKVVEKQKDGKTSEKVAQKKNDEKVIEQKSTEKEKSEKAKAKSVRKLQKSESADSKPKKTNTKEALKVRSKSEDKLKGGRVTPGKSVTKESSKKNPGDLSYASGSEEHALGATGGGVRALMDSLVTTTDSESEDDFEPIFQPAISSSKTKSSKAPAPKKNTIFSSSDESDSDSNEVRNVAPANAVPGLQQLFDRESLSDSDDSIVKDLSSLPPSQRAAHISSSSSDEDEPAARPTLPSRREQVSKSKENANHNKKLERGKVVGSKRQKVEKDHKDADKLERKSKLGDGDIRKGPSVKKSLTSKKVESKVESKPKEKVGKRKNRTEVKESKEKSGKTEELMPEKVIGKVKAKTVEKDTGKKQADKKKAEVIEKKDSDLFSDSGEEKVEYEPPKEVVKVPKERAKKVGSRSKVSRKARSGVLPKEEILEEPQREPLQDGIVEDFDTEVNNEEVAMLPQQPPCTDKVDSKPEPVREQRGEEEENVVSQTEELIVQEYETVEIVTEKPIQEEKAVVETVPPPIPAPTPPTPTPPPPKETKSTKKRKVKQRQKNRVKKIEKKEEKEEEKTEELPEQLPEQSTEPLIPEITISSEADIKVEIKAEESEETLVKESKPKETSIQDLPETEEETAAKLLGECLDAEKEAAMFEETAEATAALQFVEIDQERQIEQERQRALEEERQRGLEEEIFGESTPTPSSPAVPPTPSPAAPSPRPPTPRPVTPEVPALSMDDGIDSESTREVKEIDPSQEIKQEETEEITDIVVPTNDLEHRPEAPNSKQDEVLIKEEEVVTVVKSEAPKPNETTQSEPEAEGTIEPSKDKVEKVACKIPEEIKTEEIVTPKIEDDVTEEVKIPQVEEVVAMLPEMSSNIETHEGTSKVFPGDVTPTIKLEDPNPLLKLGNSGLLEPKPEDLEAAEETASVEVTTETASEANDSLVIAPEPFDLPMSVEVVREKLPEPPQTPHKSKKKKEHKKKKHKDKKSSKKEGRKTKKKRKRSKEERKRKKQKTSHKSDRIRSISGSSLSDLHLEGHKNMHPMHGQATAASMEPISHPGGLPIQKIENQQAVLYGHDAQWIHQVEETNKSYFPQHMYSQATGQMDQGFMKSPMVNQHLVGPNDENASPMQTISPDDIRQSLRILPGGQDDIKLVSPYYFPGMQTDNSGHVAGMLPPNGTDDKSRIRHFSGKGSNLEGSHLYHCGEMLNSHMAMSSAASDGSMAVKTEAGDSLPQQLSNKMNLLSSSDHPHEGQTATSHERDGLKGNLKESPGKVGEAGEMVRHGDDVYEFIEEEPSLVTSKRMVQNQKNLACDPYEFQESPGPSSSKVSPSKVASRGRQKPRTRAAGARTRSNSRGAGKDVRVKEETNENIALEEVRKVEAENLTLKTEMDCSSTPKAAVAELVPSGDNKTHVSENLSCPPMPLSLPNTGALAGLIPVGAIPPAEKQMVNSYTDPMRMMANVTAAATSVASALQNKGNNGRVVQSNHSPPAPSVSMPAVVAALNNTPVSTQMLARVQEMRGPITTQPPMMQHGTKKTRGKKLPERSMPGQYQIHYAQHQQQIRNIPGSSVEAVEMHFNESLRRKQQLQNMPPKMPSSLGPMPIQAGQPVGVISTQSGMAILGNAFGTAGGSAAREAPALTNQLIGNHSHGSRSPAMATGMKSGPHTIASVPGSQTSPDTSLPGVSRSGVHPNLPSTLVSVPTSASKRQQGNLNNLKKYECRVPTSVAVTTYSDASVLRARLTQNDPKMRGNEDGKIMPNQPQDGLGQFLTGEAGDRIVPSEQRLPAAYHDAQIVYYTRPETHSVIRGPGPVGPIPHGMFPDPTGQGIQGLPISGLVHQGPYGMPFPPGPFPQRLFHPLVHGEQNQPLPSPRALASPRMVVPNTSSPRLSPKIKSPGLGHGDRTAQTPDKQAELHNITLRPPPAPGITSGIPPQGQDHPEMIPHRAMPPMMNQQTQQQLSKANNEMEKTAAEERRQQQHAHLPPAQHGIPPHIQQLSQSIPDHARTTPGPHPDRGSPGSRTPGPDGRTQPVLPPNSAARKQWSPSSHTPIAALGTHSASSMPSMSGDASVMLLMRYPVMWQGMLALKQEIATIQLHYICGNKVVGADALKMAYPPLRIAQRMRLEDSQLEGVARRMQVAEESVVLLALPCGSDQDEVMSQTSAMRSGLISYLREKQAAGIINVGPEGCTDPSYVIHIFPPCEFTQRSLSHKAPDLLESVMNLAYMMFVIATC
ncbi:uncharacterized protein [Apostichopus japonicus]|uniref:uncharacterized protein isoform X3 n=1 Tax=Stichopus japonicus TaxID=307972 RepID=UPI003AB1D777